MNPAHPAKLVIVIEGGLVKELFIDKDTPLRIFVADYDAGKVDGFDEVKPDARGQLRWLAERLPVRDTMEIRAVLNKRGVTPNGKDGK